MHSNVNIRRNIINLIGNEMEDVNKIWGIIIWKAEWERERERRDKKQIKVGWNRKFSISLRTTYYSFLSLPTLLAFSSFPSLTLMMWKLKKIKRMKKLWKILKVMMVEKRQIKDLLTDSLTGFIHDLICHFYSLFTYYMNELFSFCC